jgi:ankyrin repeat protein
MEIFNILLKKPITNIDQKDFMGNTILHRAVKANNLQIVEALIKRGAKTAITNRTGDTPLSLALDYRIKDYLEKVQKTQ